MNIMIAKAAAILGVSQSTVRNWTRQGLIPVAMVSLKGVRYYDEETIKSVARKMRGETEDPHTATVLMKDKDSDNRSERHHHRDPHGESQPAVHQGFC